MNRYNSDQYQFDDWQKVHGSNHQIPVEPIEKNKHYVPTLQNGLVVNVLSPSTQIRDYDLTSQDKAEDSFSKNALFGIQDPTPLAYYFFSKYNRQRVMDRIRYEVYLRSNYKYIIAPQNEQELQIIMRAFYLQYALNLNCQFKEQVEDLNTKVIEYCVPQIITEIQQYFGYLHDVQYMPIPIDLPKNLSNAGTRTLRSVSTTF